MKKKGIALLIVTVMGVAMLAGCGKSDGGAGGSAGGEQDGSVGSSVISEEGSDDLSQHRTITAWLYADDYKYYSSYSENPVVAYLNEKFNCTLEFQQPPMGSEQDQLNLMLGTGEYTDVFEVTYSQDSVAVMYEDSVIQDLAPYLETYMPNFYSFMQQPENEDVRKALYDEEGHLFTLPSDVKEDDIMLWGGMVYRRDILETMTGGNVAFPSGEEDPVTVEDWEYMLELMSQYFQASGMPDYACLIIPAKGYFDTGELENGFGAAASFYVVDGQAKYGPTTQEFYNYLTKMHEWYEKGWIYQDFASRTTDVFYLPNPALTYGGAAGVWFGLTNQLDDAMSIPDYNLYMDVRPIPSPLDTANGQDGSKSGTLINVGDRANPNSRGWVVSSKCSEENLIRFLTAMDFMYTKEGAMMKYYGLDAEHGAADSEVYQSLGLEAGAYTIDENDVFQWHELLDPDKTEEPLDKINVTGQRLPGLIFNKYENSVMTESARNAAFQWMKYGNGNNFPGAATATAEESSILTAGYTTYTDYLDSMVPKFIMGTEELNETTWAAFVEQMDSLGVEECTRIQQEMYDRFMSK